MTHQVLNDDGEAININDPELSDLLQHPGQPSLNDNLPTLPDQDPLDPDEVWQDLCSLLS